MGTDQNSACGEFICEHVEIVARKSKKHSSIYGDEYRTSPTKQGSLFLWGLPKLTNSMYRSFNQINQLSSHMASWETPGA
jgi:hypothetical protein